MTTYAHVTVTVVEDGVTTTYDIPKVMDFSIDRAVRGIAFWMRPLANNEGSIYTLTTDAPHLAEPLVHRSEAHRLVPDHNGEPSCLCGWTPTPPEFATREAAVSGVHKHVQSVEN